MNTLNLQTLSSIYANMPVKPTYITSCGAAFCGDSNELLEKLPDESVDLVITSPPFALQRQKDYGNIEQQNYVEWFASFAETVHKKLKSTGSFVIDLGGAYQKGTPTRSLYNFRLLIHLCDEIGFFLAEDFYWYNPAKLPSPIEWVNKRKIRVKDSVNTIWWLSKSEFPKADVTKVLVEYSERMKKLLENPEKFYTPKNRPSGHQISESFARDNGGAIPSNLLQISNTDSNGSYLTACKIVKEKPHPARFPAKLPEFFIKFLTDSDDLVIDIFSGSNTTGYTAKMNGRRWISFEENLNYIAASSFRFLPKEINDLEVREIYEKIINGENVELQKYQNRNFLIHSSNI
ncbi:site-specific DNA-methyltransferase [soil metagenome]